MDIRYRRTFFSMALVAGFAAVALLLPGCQGDAPTETNLDAVNAAISEAALADAGATESRERAPGGARQIVVDGITLSTPTTARARSSTSRPGPLYVVDGVVLSGELADNEDLISALDIDRIEVIRGALAAAEYGPRAANGVVKIFTKR